MQGTQVPEADLLCVVGARPNFIKIAPLMSALRAQCPQLNALLVHTGQHYDQSMSESFFEQLGIAAPHYNLEVGSGSHTVQTAEVMKRFEPVVDRHRPVAVLVVGDVNSTIACALVAAKKQTAVIHVEAGLRSFDRTMPEEINRILTDQLSDLLFTTERSALDNLAREGIAPDKVHFVGNVMIDTLLKARERAPAAPQTLAALGADPSIFRSADGYAVLTLHRPANVDDPATLGILTETLVSISEQIPIVFPVHPRTRQRLADFGQQKHFVTPRILLTEPLSYLQLLGLVSSARLTLTDSGGLQEETTALGIPCITLRDNTERPITIEQGTNVMTGANPDAIRSAVHDVLRTGGKAGRIPEYWDGRSAERIAAVIGDWATERLPACR